MTRNCILVDLDHVLADAAWRDELLGRWDEYHAAAKDDVPIHDVTRMVTALLSDDIMAIGITGRPEKWRALTNQWLSKHKLYLDEVLMRPDGDFRQAPEVKLALARERFGDDEGIRQNVLFILDDHEGVIAAFKGIGITALHVHARTRSRK